MSAPGEAGAQGAAHGLFIAGTDTGIGKTRVTVGLLRALSAAGWRARGMKPVATGTICSDAGNINEDVAAIAAVSDPIAARADLNPYCFDWAVSPHIAASRAGIVVDPAYIVAAYGRLARGCDAVVVEGTGGWLAPIGPTTTMADVAQALRLPVVLVVGLRLGCLNHALLSAQAIASAGVPLIGWVANLIDPSMAALAENLEALTQRLPVPQMALLPHAPDGKQDPAALAAAARAFMTHPGVKAPGQ
jgi:dethiobiotin synthetase